MYSNSLLNNPRKMQGDGWFFLLERKEERMAETYLAQAIAATEEASTYDTNVKYLLADKQILARILKYSVKEFQDMEIDDIISCIGDEIEVGVRLLDPGLTNLGRVVETKTEDSVPGEGQIFYDIRFTAYHKGMEMKFLINLEAQRSSDPGKLGYHLENRILFYLARMISAQKQTEFFHSDFDQLKMVRSIWICMDHGENEDSIEEISLERKTVFGEEGNPCEIGLMKGIIINIRSGENLKESKHVLISMLEELISKMSIEEKKRVLTEKYGMKMTVELEGRMHIMCNWSEVIIEQGLKQGIEQGLKQGIEQGIEQGIDRKLTELIEIKMRKGKSVEQIAEELEETVEHIEELIRKNNL